MAEYSTQRYYWIKITDRFMTSDTVDFLMEQKDGANYVVLYQMLCLKSVNNDGRLSRTIGEVIIPYDEAKIQRDTKWFTIDTIRVALELYKKLGLIYEQEDGILRITDFDKMIFSQTESAMRKQEQRRRALEAQRESEDNEESNEATNGGQMSRQAEDKCPPKCPPYKEKEKYIYPYKVVAVSAGARDGQPQQPDLPDISEEDDDMDYDDPESKLEPWGKDKVVYLTEGQAGDLLDKLGLATFDYYIAKLSDFIVKKDANVQNHYKTILKWYKEDTRV